MENSPFGEIQRSRPTISLSLLLFMMVVFAFLSIGLSMAAWVPMISNSVNAFLGLPQVAKPDKPDRSTHLFFLLFCYSSPLLLSLCVGLIQTIGHWWSDYQQRRIEADSATGENPLE